MTATEHNASDRIVTLAFAAAAWFAAPPAWAAMQGAELVFTTGDVMIEAKDGTRHVAVRGEALDAGDTVLTGEGRVQLGFSDGGIVDLAPQGAFRVDDYFFDGSEDGTEKKLMSLIRGALRTISGAIGHVHHDSYKLDTPVASIGIRGTSYTASLGPGLTVEVGDGAIEVVNGAGALQVLRGQSAFVQDTSSMPVLMPKLNMPFNAPLIAPTRKADSQQSSGQQTATRATNSSQPASGQILAGSVSAPVGNLAIVEVGGQAATPQASSGLPGDPVIQAPSAAAASGPLKMTDSSSDDTIGWSRWVGADGKSPIYVLAGVPTVQLPTQGTAVYELVGGSGPTFASGQGGAGTAAGALAVAFGSHAAVGLDLTLLLPDGSSYRVATSGGLSQPSQSQITVSGGSSFGADNLSVMTNPGAAGCTTGTCTGSVKGFFSGSAADRAAVAYGIVAAPGGSTGVTPVVNGTAIFAKGGGAKTGSAVSAKVGTGG